MFGTLEVRLAVALEVRLAVVLEVRIVVVLEVRVVVALEARVVVVLEVRLVVVPEQVGLPDTAWRTVAVSILAVHSSAQEGDTPVGSALKPASALVPAALLLAATKPVSPAQLIRCTAGLAARRHAGRLAGPAARMCFEACFGLCRWDIPVLCSREPGIEAVVAAVALAAVVAVVTVVAAVGQVLGNYSVHLLAPADTGVAGEVDMWVLLGWHIGVAGSAAVGPAAVGPAAGAVVAAEQTTASPAAVVDCLGYTAHSRAHSDIHSAGEAGMHASAGW